MKQEPSQSTKKEWLITEYQQGFSLVEVILSIAVFALLITTLIGAYFYGQESTALAGNRARAVMIAEEGLEAVRNIRDEDFSNLEDGTYGLNISNNAWVLSGLSDNVDIFTRQIEISPIDGDRKEVTSTVTWQQNPQRSGIISVETYLTNWQKSVVVGPPPPSDCSIFCQDNGYSGGVCRPNPISCAVNQEVYEPDGDIYCTESPSADTCCCIP